MQAQQLGSTVSILRESRNIMVVKETTHGYRSWGWSKHPLVAPGSEAGAVGTKTGKEVSLPALC